MSKGLSLVGAILIVVASQTCVADTGSGGESPNAASAEKRTGLKGVADKTAMGAWAALRAGRMEDARYRFNQALLLDSSNGLAHWGLGIIHAQREELEESRISFEKAEPMLSGDVNFNVDFARTLGYAGIAARNEKMVIGAFERFEKVYRMAPQHRVNLENWAVILFNTGNYAEAWRKIELAEKTPSGKDINQKFVNVLQSKMARPASK